MIISTKMKNLFTSPRPARAGRAASIVAAGVLAAAAFGGAGATGCSEADVATGQGVDGAVAASALAPAEVFGAKIAQHPLFGQLTQRTTSEVTTIVSKAAGRPQSQSMATLQTLRNCRQTYVASACLPAAQDAGLSTDVLKANRAQAQKIAADVGLAGANPETVKAAFRFAEWTKSGSGAANPLAGVVAGRAFVGEPDWACDADCREEAGNALGAARAGHHASLSKTATTGGAGGSGAGGGGVTASEVQDWIEVAESVFDFIDGLIWDSDEEDKECVSDSDCVAREFCHKIGENDCRADHNEGHLCQRGAECESNCCKPHISAGGLPICRPSEKCD